MIRIVNSKLRNYFNSILDEMEIVVYLNHILGYILHWEENVCRLDNSF